MSASYSDFREIPQIPQYPQIRCLTSDLGNPRFLGVAQLDEGHMTTGDVARALKASQAAIQDWADQGVLPSFRTPGGHRRFRREDVEAFLKSQEPAA